MPFYNSHLYKYLTSTIQKTSDPTTEQRIKCRKLLQSEGVKDIIIQSVLGSNVSKSWYPSFNDCTSNEAIFSVTYIPNNYSSQYEHLPPIAIVIQDTLDESAMADLVYHSAKLYGQYKMLPILVIVSMKGFACDKMEAEFGSDISKNGIFKMNEAKSCLLWALHFHVFTWESIEAYIHQSPMDRLVALIHCIIQTEEISENQRRDPTMKMLLKLLE